MLSVYLADINGSDGDGDLRMGFAGMGIPLQAVQRGPDGVIIWRAPILSSTVFTSRKSLFWVDTVMS